MSTDEDDLASSSKESDTDLLMRLIRREMVSIPVEHWGFFFPCHVAVWRFLEERRPGVLGPLKATFRGEPYFEGKGSTWFCGFLGNRPEYLDLLEATMYPMTREAPAAVRERVRQRGFFLDEEIHSIDPALVRRIAEVVLEEVDKGLRDGLIV